MSRQEDLARFYELLSDLEKRVGGKQTLADCHGRMAWPSRGVYFFFEEGEIRSDSGSDLRVVRVGTHALKAGSKTTLWKRLSQHRGTVKTGTGNHRGSIFRLIVGASLIQRDGLNCASWGVGSDPGKAAKRLGLARAEIKDAEHSLELAVSEHVRAMPFLWVNVDDAPGPDSLRGLIERNSIALLSNYERTVLDPASPSWLGSRSDRPKVRASGLWNNNHVAETHDPAFLDVLETLAAQ